MKTLRDRFFSGLVWMGSARLGRRLVSVLVNILLARMIVPADFGVVAMATVVTGFLQLFNDFGLGAALVQAKNPTQRAFSSIFWLNVVVSSALALVVVVGSSFVSAFYAEPRVEPVLYVLALVFPIGALSQVHRAIIRRELDFRRLAVVQVCGVLTSGIIAVIMAMQGFGVWAIVARTVIEEGVITTLYWLTNPWRPSKHFDREAARPLVRYGAYLLGTNVLSYASRSADNLVIAKVWGAAALGLYSRAYVLMLMPMLTVSRLVGHVLFPVLASIQSDRDRVRSIMLRAMGAISLITFPAIAGVIVTADELVSVVLGDQWSELPPLLRILCPIGFWQSFHSVLVTVYNALGQTRTQFRVDLVGHAMNLAGILIGVRWGLSGVATGYCVASALHALIHQYTVGKLIEIHWSELLHRIAPVALIVGVMSGTTTIAGHFTPGPEWLRLVAMVMAGIGSYAALLWTFKPVAFQDVRAALRRRRSRNGPLTSAPEQPVSESDPEEP